jgi:uncharacterized protein (DUF1778 family)
MKNNEMREASINIRALPSQRALIDRAAAVRNKTRSDFMLEAACQEAENVLLDQRLFQPGEAAYDAFQTALDAPVTDNEALRKLLNKSVPWES